ncbi:MAG: hypothetical protein WD276_09470 [Actinomycetota bacterium]
MPRAQHQSGRRVSPALIIVPVLVLIVGLAIGGFFLFMRGGSGGNGGSEPSPETPEFSFQVGKVDSVPTGKEEGAKSAQSAAKGVTETMDQFYTAAFLDPANWQAGNYEPAWSVFDGGAVGDAKKNAEILTLGPGAGQTYETVNPGASSLKVKVLVNDSGHAQTAVASVEFSAAAKAKAGGTTKVISNGAYFLEPAERGWRIYAFSVTRNDEEAGGKASPSPSPR